MKMNNSKTKKLILIVILNLILILSACSAELVETNIETTENNFEVHFIDVGQADSILIKGPNNENILIDGGNNGDGESIVEYVRNQGVESFKAVIGTHPHEDHIGGLDNVIESFNVEKVYMPKVAHTTKTFEDVLKVVQKKGLKITTAKKGVKIPVEGYDAIFLGPVSDEYKDLNNYSAVLKVTYMNNSFLFQGDAEELSEEEILSSDMNSEVKADVIKLGHHGSSTSSSKEYIKKVDPQYGIIMAGVDNDYGHPHMETMELLQKMNIKVYRTDKQGTIVATSDGDNITFNVDSGDYSYNQPKHEPNKEENIKAEETEEKLVDENGRGLIKGNINSKREKIYHMPGGAYYDGTIPEQWFATEKEAQDAGFRKSSK